MLELSPRYARPSRTQGADHARALEDLKFATDLGRLSDRAVRAALAARRGDKPSRADRAALRTLSKTLRVYVRLIDNPFDLAAQVPRGNLELLKTARGRNLSPRALAPGASSSAELKEHLEGVVTALDALDTGDAKPDEVELVRSEFNAWGESTLALANESMRSSHAGSLWTTRFSS